MPDIMRLEGWLPVPVFAVWIVFTMLFFLSFCLAFRFRKKEWYFSLFFLLTSCACAIVYFCKDGGGTACATTATLFGGYFGGTYAVLLGIISLAERRERRRKKRQEESRLAPFVLPDKDNEFLRDRLRTSLCKNKENNVRTEEAFQLTYIRRVLTRLKGKNLTPADRVELDRISIEITSFCYQEELTDTQLRLLNSHFARVLKLSAKYAV